MPRLTGKTALITGASSGIGRAIAIRFAAEGATVAINYPFERNRPDAQATLDALQASNHLIVQADISQESAVTRMFALTLAALGPLDILINNAGILATPSDSHQTPTEDFDRVLAVNLRGTFLCSREAVKHFIDANRPGVIVNNSSVHQTIPKPKYLPYSISKGAIDNLTKSLALEYAGRGIRVNAVGPGAVITPMNNAWVDDPAARAIVESHIPMGRPAAAEEIAAVFAFLASDDASYITGQTLYACGGLTLYPEFRSAWASGE